MSCVPVQASCHSGGKGRKRKDETIASSRELTCGLDSMVITAEKRGETHASLMQKSVAHGTHAQVRRPCIKGHSAEAPNKRCATPGAPSILEKSRLTCFYFQLVFSSSCSVGDEEGRLVEEHLKSRFF